MKPYKDYIIKYKRSFTIIDVIMVIVIIGILMAVSIPRFNVYYDLKLQAAAKKLVLDTRYVQNRAISQHANTRLNFDVVNNTYRAETCSSNCGVAANWIAIKEPFTHTDFVMDYKKDIQYGGVDITNAAFAATAILRFDWQGIPQDGGGSNLTAAGVITLQLRDKSINVNVTPQTGKITVQ